MNNTVIGIHPIHRKLATIVAMNTDINGNTFIGGAELKQIIPLLRQNYELVRQLDELKQLSFLAYEMGDMGDMVWQQDICRQIERLEQELEI